MINKKVGQQMIFTGGAENSPRVQVATFFCPGSLNHGRKNFRIMQDGQVVHLSPETMRAILDWGREE